MCCLKEDGGMGFRSLAKFNRGFIKLNISQTLLSLLGNNSSFTWKSIWAARRVLKEGLCWKVGNGSEIFVFNDAWVPDL
ncbi:reverse transcriptase-like protein [Gossypium australe]|uniref:Reverse transcriptase-like protein n=1 Tax=Gossypium australe TaxID=47621 RepID=A0A5B6WKA7_9ROSI|nr:reverse transcriptase-like protein [Gossypium australe]